MTDWFILFSLSYIVLIWTLRGSMSFLVTCLLVGGPGRNRVVVNQAGLDPYYSTLVAPILVRDKSPHVQYIRSNRVEHIIRHLLHVEAERSRA